MRSGFKSGTDWVRVALLALTVAWVVGSLWLAGELETRDWIPIALSGLGLVVALATALWSGLQQKRHLAQGFVVTLWDRWSAPEMATVRETCWTALSEAPIREGKKQIGWMKTSRPDAYKAIARVNHFFADLYGFVRAGLLDEREVRAIFRDTLQSYYCHLHFASIGDTMPREVEIAQQQWFDEKVLGLGRILRLDAVEHFQRYGDTIAQNLQLVRDSQVQLPEPGR